MRALNLRIGLFASLFLLIASTSFSASPSASFDHSKGPTTTQTAADAGDTITVTISNTCPMVFKYAQVALQGESSGTPSASDAAAKAAKDAAAGQACASSIDAAAQESFFLRQSLVCELTTQNVFIIHQKQYGGYNIEIKRKDGYAAGTWKGVSSSDYASALKAFKTAYSTDFNNDSGTKTCDAIQAEALTDAQKAVPAKTTNLDDVTDNVIVATAEPFYELAGGLTVSNLVDRKYALVPNPAGGTGLGAQIITENKSAEDTKRLGFAGFIHIHNPNCTDWVALCEHVAATLGIGISTSSGSGANINAFIGPSFRLAGQWFLTAGYNWGSIATLPAGETVGKSPTTANALSNLGSRTSGALFFALSYSFLSPGTSFFQKPFSSSPQVANQGAATTKPAGQ